MMIYRKINFKNNLYFKLEDSALALFFCTTCDFILLTDLIDFGFSILAWNLPLLVSPGLIYIGGTDHNAVT